MCVNSKSLLNLRRLFLSSLLFILSFAVYCEQMYLKDLVYYAADSSIPYSELSLNSFELDDSLSDNSLSIETGTVYLIYGNDLPISPAGEHIRTIVGGPVLLIPESYKNSSGILSVIAEFLKEEQFGSCSIRLVDSKIDWLISKQKENDESIFTRSMTISQSAGSKIIRYNRETIAFLTSYNLSAQHDTEETVRKGEHVNCRIVSNSIDLTIPGYSLDTASIGNIVEVRLIPTGKILKGILITSEEVYIQYE